MENRVYLFDADLAVNNYASQSVMHRFNAKITCELDIKKLKELGVTHLFSVSEITNAIEKKIKLLYKSENIEYYYKVYIYKI